MSTSAALDALFLLLALLAARTFHAPSHPSDQTFALPAHPPLTPLTPRTPLSPASAARSSAVGPLGPVPLITITPDVHAPSAAPPPSWPSAGRGIHLRRRPSASHKRKSVSFSLSSMDDMLPPATPTPHRRPPTPFVAHVPPPSPDPAAPSLPATPMAHSKQSEDPMGVQKMWLMA
ncbi:hypothetical protein Q5752_000669 [Cryptotrichosporon argae]